MVDTEGPPSAPNDYSETIRSGSTLYVHLCRSWLQPDHLKTLGVLLICGQWLENVLGLWLDVENDDQHFESS